MGRYISEEFPQALKSRLSRFYMIGIVGLCVLANIAVIGFRLIYGKNEGTFTYNVIEYATWCFVIPYYTCILIADIAFGGTLREAELSFKRQGAGMSRTAFYFSKLILSILLALVYLVITSVVFIFITELFHYTDEPVRFSYIRDFFEKLLCAVPLWLAGIGMGNMFLFLFPDKRKAYLYYLGLTVLLERGIMLLAMEPFQLAPFRALRTLTVTQQFSLIPYPADPARNIPLTIFLGFLYLILSTAIGLYFWRRRDQED
ncbi:MAG: hypothetical protein IJ873_07345 [Lachnospiraceae bacterium]|nr:hypothetical protein [Lachnospiraceae bacterium]